jgi:hypothetical protein
VKKYQAQFEIRIDAQFEFEAEDDDAAQEMIDGWTQDGSHDLINRGFMGEEIDGSFWEPKKKKKKKPTPGKADE